MALKDLLLSTGGRVPEPDGLVTGKPGRVPEPDSLVIRSGRDRPPVR